MTENIAPDIVEKDSLAYFNGDDLAASVWRNKYALRDHDGNYEPNNLRWASKSEQNLNRRKFKRNKK